MEKKRHYKNMKELAAAFASGELDRKEYALMLDNDWSGIRWMVEYPEGIEEGTSCADAYSGQKNDECRSWFFGNGYEDFQDACEAAGIPCEWV